MKDIVENNVKRERYFTTAEDFARHLEYVGKAIIEDANQMNLQPENICLINIDVGIAPDTELTTIRYEIHRRADVRLGDLKNG